MILFTLLSLLDCHWWCQETPQVPPWDCCPSWNSKVSKVHRASYPQAPVPKACPWDCSRFQGNCFFWLRLRRSSWLTLFDRLISVSNLLLSWRFRKPLRPTLYLSLRTPTWLRFMPSVLPCMWFVLIVGAVVVYVIALVNPRISLLPGVFGARGPKLYDICSAVYVFALIS